MRPRSRDINIFNLSMLDVIAGAMGAFLIVMVVLLPYYRKQSPTPPVTPETVQRLEQERAISPSGRRAPPGRSPGGPRAIGAAASRAIPNSSGNCRRPFC
jgi:hypothetical protein